MQFVELFGFVAACFAFQQRNWEREVFGRLCASVIGATQHF
jgi:hypothetical protein